MSQNVVYHRKFNKIYVKQLCCCIVPNQYELHRMHPMHTTAEKGPNGQQMTFSYCQKLNWFLFINLFILFKKK